MGNLRKRKKIRPLLKTKFKILSLLQDEHKNLAVYTVSKSVNISVIYSICTEAQAQVWQEVKWDGLV